MNKFKRLAVLLLMGLSLMMISGCMRYSTTVEVKRNGKADITMLVAAQIPEDSDSDDSSTDTEETRKELEEKRLAEDVKLEEERQAIVAMNVENERKKAELEAYAVKELISLAFSEPVNTTLALRLSSPPMFQVNVPANLAADANVVPLPVSPTPSP